MLISHGWVESRCGFVPEGEDEERGGGEDGMGRNRRRTSERRGRTSEKKGRTNEKRDELVRKMGELVREGAAGGTMGKSVFEE